MAKLAFLSFSLARGCAPFVIFYVGSIDRLDIFFRAKDTGEMAERTAVAFERQRFSGRMCLHMVFKVFDGLCNRRCGYF